MTAESVADRVRKERPELNLPQCGTPRGYQLGCGCMPCREAKAKQRSQNNQERRERRPIPQVMSVPDVELLRAKVPCLGCGAVRRPVDGGKTTITHQRGCPVKKIKETAA